MVSSISSLRGKQRFLFFGLVIVLGVLYLSKQMVDSHQLSLLKSTTSNKEEFYSSCHITRSTLSSSITTTRTKNETRQHTYLNLNDLNPTAVVIHDNNNNIEYYHQHILVLTTLQNDQDYLDNYFDLLDKSTYPNNLISIGLLISDSTDGTLEQLYDHVARLQNRYRNQFYNIDVFQKDFQLDKKKDDMSLNSKRATLARAKNYLLSASIHEIHSWIVWVDVKLYSYPVSIFEDLMLANADVIVPNCLMHRENDDEFWGYDRNNWQETDHSWKLLQEMDLNQILMEDYNEYSVGRNLLVDMPTHSGKDFKVPLDAVGTTFTMVKATVHREGAIFPPFVYQHELDTEGFGKMVKSMGFTVYGIPSYFIYHF